MGTRLSRRREVVIGERDRQILELASQHRLILPAHAAALLGVSVPTARARLRALAEGGYVHLHRLFAGQPPCCQITARGLAAIDSGLPRPRLDLRAYFHDVGVAWLWLAAKGGTFGPLSRVVSERALRSHDGRLEGRGGQEDAEPLGVRMGGIGPHGRERLHYPDLLLVTERGERIAVELELSSKGRMRRDQILAAYGSDVRVAGVLYLVERPDVASAVQRSARRLGIGSLVHVQRVRQPRAAPAPRQTVAERIHQL